MPDEGNDREHERPQSTWSLERTRPPEALADAERIIEDNLEQRRAVFARLRRELPSLSVLDQLSLIIRLMEHSVDDGLALTQDIRLSGLDLLASVTSNSVIAKHPKFALALANKLMILRPLLGQWPEVQERLAQVVTQLRRDPSWLNLSGSPPVSVQGQALWEALDAYYTTLLPLRSVTELARPIDRRSRGQKLGEQHLARARLVLEPHYYTRQIRVALTQHLTGSARRLLDHLAVLKEAGQAPGLGEGVIRANGYLAADGLVARSDLQTIATEYGFDLNDPIVAHSLTRAQYRPLDVIYDQEETLATSALLQELEASLVRRGYLPGELDIGRDDATGHYHIKSLWEESAGSAKPGMRAEQWRTVARFPRTVSIGPDDPVYSELLVRGRPDLEDTPNFSLRTDWIIHNGSLYQVVSRVNNQDAWIVYPDGRRSPIFDVIVSKEFAQSSGGVLAWVARDGDQYVVYRDDTNKRFSAPVGYRIADLAFTDTKDRGDESLVWTIRHLTTRQSMFIQDGNVMDDECRVLTVVDGEAVYLKKEPTGLWVIGPHGQPVGPYEKVYLDVTQRTQFRYCAKTLEHTWLLVEDSTILPLPIPHDPTSVQYADDRTYLIFPPSKPGSEYSILVVHDGAIDSQTIESSARILGVLGSELFYREQDSSKLKVVGGENLLLHAKARSIAHFTRPLARFNGDVLLATYDHNDDLTAVWWASRPEQVMNFDDAVVLKVEPNQLWIAERGETLQISVYEYAQRLTLNSHEEQLLMLLNLLVQPTLEGIEAYELAQVREKSAKPVWLRLADGTRQVVSTLRQMVKDAPSVLLNSLAATKDDHSDATVERIARLLFPELPARIDRRRSHQPIPNGRNFLATDGEQVIELLDGDPRALGESIVQLRQPVVGLFVIGLYGRYHRSNRRWEAVVVPTVKPTGPMHELTAELSDVSGLSDVHLPKLLHAVLISERIKGVTRRGQERTLPVRVNALGEGRVNVPKDIKRIVYSQMIPELPVIPESVSEAEYRQFVESMARQLGPEGVDRVAELPALLSLFVQSIQPLLPKERLMAIEQFVMKHSYYDFDNAQVQAEKENISLEELFEFMQSRVTELKRCRPDLVDQDDLLFAGVCADFAKLTVALLRASGLVSGCLRGLRSNGQTTTLGTQHIHASAYAAWPGPDGTVTVVQVETTPSGTTPEEERLLAWLRQPTIAEREAQLAEQVPEQVAQTEAQLAELERLVATLDEAAIRRLANGELEQVLNTVLSGVKESHLRSLDAALNAARYAGLNLNLTDPVSVWQVASFLQDEVQRERVRFEEDHFHRGGAFLTRIQDFIRRFETDSSINSWSQAADTVMRVIDLVHPVLDPVERRAAIAVLTYLRARRMSRW